MAERLFTSDPIEPERYEFSEPPRYRFVLNRRRFIETLGAGVIIGVAFRDGLALAPRLDVEGSPVEPIGAWLHIDESGSVTVYTGKVEVGQDIRTSLTQAVADELHIAPEAIELVMGDTNLTPFDAGTFGSRSTPQMAPQLRRAAAAARRLLIELAAEHWLVGAESLALTGGRITHEASGRALGIGEMTRGERLVQELADDVAPLPRDGWTIAGTSLPKVAGHDMVTGRHRYTSDMRLPGIMTGKVLRPPATTATLTSLDAARTREIPGVVVVQDGDFVGVAAADDATATRAVALLRAEWSREPSPGQRELFEHLRSTAESGRGRPDSEGSIEAGLTAADERLEATYTVAYIAHVPLEPRAAVAQWENGRLTVWTGTQRPFNVRTELSRAFGISEDDVRVLVPDTGSAYGGKHTGDAAIEAARIARATEGQPVKVVWTRDEEFMWAYFRPAGVIDVRSGVRRDGGLTAWELHNYNSGAAGIRTSYDVPNHRTVYHPSNSPLRQGSYRALAATANTFARETHMDELAERIGMDPLAFRLRNLGEPRLRAVLEAAADRFGWSDWTGQAGHGIGIACGTEKGGFVATCAEVAVDSTSGRVRLVRVVEAFESGAIVNPDGLENQVEGAIVMGLGGALWEAIEFEEGRILNARLSNYRVPRFSDMPELEIVLLDRKDLPSAGAGETPIIALAPAIGGAIQRATGVRLRSLPLVPNGLGALKRTGAD